MTNGTGPTCMEEFSTRVGTIVDQWKTLKQAEVVHNIKTTKN